MSVGPFKSSYELCEAKLAEDEGLIPLPSDLLGLLLEYIVPESTNEAQEVICDWLEENGYDMVIERLAGGCVVQVLEQIHMRENPAILTYLRLLGFDLKSIPNWRDWRGREQLRRYRLPVLPPGECEGGIEVPDEMAVEILNPTVAEASDE